MLQNDPTVTTDQVIKLIWDKPFDGGLPDLEYDIYYDDSVNVFQLLQASVATEYYVTTVPLVAGNTY